MKRSSLIFILLSFLCVSISLNFYQASYSEELNEQISKRDTLIRTERIDHISHDTIKIHHYTSYSIDGQEISFEDLFDMLLKMEKERNTYRDSCNYYKNYYSISQKHHNVDFKEERHGDTVIYSYNMAPSQDMVKIDSTINSLATTKAIFDRVCKRYDISVINQEVRNGVLYFDIQAQKLDSALMLLPYYRHKLKYDSKKKIWRIK